MILQFVAGVILGGILLLAWGLDQTGPAEAGAAARQPAAKQQMSSPAP